MAKKRKATPRPQEPHQPAEVDSQDSRKRIRTYEDVADSDDEFHLNQDEVRLGERPDAKRRRKWAEQEEFLQPSDEEVLGYSEDENDDEEIDVDQGASNQAARAAGFEISEEDKRKRWDADDDEEMGWGTSRADLYGADTIETEEQALEEEAEARRLQNKKLESMQAADYGFDDIDWQQATGGDGVRDEANKAAVTEVLPQFQIAPDLGPTERLKLLKSRYPEFDLLSKDLLDLQAGHSEMAEKAQFSPIARTKLRASTAYIAALVMYFSLFTSPASKGKLGVTAIPPAKLREHLVMDSLVKCRELWVNVKQLSNDAEKEEEEEGIETTKALHFKEAVMNDNSLDEVDVEMPRPKQTRAQRYAEAAQSAIKERKAERMRRIEADLAGLDELIAPTRSRKTIKAQRMVGNESDLGEEAPLTAREADDKAKRKKSLRFYTSQIAQKVNRRGAAGRNAGGDDDIPYRERLRDRQARLNAEAEKRGKHHDVGADLGGESDEDDARQALQIRADVDEDDYYDLIAARTAKKKSNKADLTEARKQAILQGGRVVEQQVIGADGKRKISYAIEKNKGLTPHRKKELRNPRVKKRKKYDEKKKKLASIKPVYKGGEGRGGYGGELTGIKKGLVKSTKL